MGSPMKLLGSAIELRSTYLRWLSGPGAPSTDNHRKGIAPISLLTRRSTSRYPVRTSRGVERVVGGRGERDAPAAAGVPADPA